jgi:hypothetical protein
VRRSHGGARLREMGLTPKPLLASFIDPGLVGCKISFHYHIRPVALVRSHEERKWFFEQPNQSRTTQGSSWGYLKVNCSETLSIFGDTYPQNGSKNEQRAPRTSMGCPHQGPSVVSGHLASRMSWDIVWYCRIASHIPKSLFFDRFSKNIYVFRKTGIRGSDSLDEATRGGGRTYLSSYTKVRSVIKPLLYRFCI